LQARSQTHRNAIGQQRRSDQKDQSTGARQFKKEEPGSQQNRVNRQRRRFGMEKTKMQKQSQIAGNRDPVSIRPRKKVVISSLYFMKRKWLT
jgi:hypothetical protein